MYNFPHIEEWLKLADQTKLRVFTETGADSGLMPFAIEKDWWVVHTIALIYKLNCARSLVFKGGTSLSKGWRLIQRFSEDIDLALNREYLGFDGELENAEIRRLRRRSFEYLTNTFAPGLQGKFLEYGFKDVTVKTQQAPNHDQDPVIIEIYYPKLTEKDTYLKPGVLVEIGSRSLIEPFTNRILTTMVAERYPVQPFSDNPITVPVVNPERTFLEKIFLLHEELHRPEAKKRIDGLSRHLYDIEVLSHTEFARKAFLSPQLYFTIVDHRRKFNRISGVDFNNHKPDKIMFVPSANYLSEWENDYNQMRESMIYGETLSFKELIKNLLTLQSQLNHLQWID
mgnify:CR=1 FL=1